MFVVVVGHLFCFVGFFGKCFNQMLLFLYESDFDLFCFVPLSVALALVTGHKDRDKVKFIVSKKKLQCCLKNTAQKYQHSIT